MTDHIENAREHLRNAEGAIEHLAQLYRVPSYDRPPHAVASCQEDLRQAFAFAKIEATIAMAESLELIAAYLGGTVRPLGRAARMSFDASAAEAVELGNGGAR